MKAILTILFLLAAALSGFAQENPRAELDGEYGSIGCDQAGAYFDNFLVGLRDRPSLKGYAVIYPKKGMLKEASWEKKRVEGRIFFRKFDKARITIVEGEERDDLRVQLWLVPAGAEKPEIKEGSWPQPVKDLSKPFIYFTMNGGWDLCPGNDEETYVDFLAEHPEMRGHIVVFGTADRQGIETRDYWLKEFTSDGRIERKRFKVFFTRHRKNIADEAEFWIVPPRKKK